MKDYKEWKFLGFELSRYEDNKGIVHRNFISSHLWTHFWWYPDDYYAIHISKTRIGIAIYAGYFNLVIEWD